MIIRDSGRRAASLAVTTAVAFTTLAGTPAATAHSPRPAPTGPAAALEGTWRMDGYGTLVSVEDGGRRLRTYETTAAGCLPGVTDARRSRAGEPFRQEGESTITVTADGPSRARLAHAESVGHRGLRRAGALPAACREGQPAKNPRAVFDTFWQTYAENYPFFAVKGVDWKAVRDRYRPRVTGRTTDAELFGILRKMIEPLHDGHTSIVTGYGKDDPRYAGHREDTTLPDGKTVERLDAAVAAAVGVPLRTWGRGAVSYADLPDGTGYLRVTRFTRYTQAGTYEEDSAELDRALDAIFTPERTKALRGVILDLRFNGGGSDRLGLRIAERLTDRPYTAYAKHARNDATDPRKFTAPEPVGVAPHRGGPVYTGPLAVLAGRLTISAGETTTQALMGRTPAPVRIGENTQGSFSDVLERRLPNGWTFGLPNEEYLSAADGRTTYDGAGIAPHVRTAVFTEEELAAGRDSALAEARRRLAAGR
ncbi:S41 family peptidase [Streptomyces griseocarneus]|uniref:S41 family peptidase n=1 Tax=Streptomyces griseocarneus TaxID=51201 RepID=UPI00167CBA81|nr:S41 family peptidase [Streptomyces griseocarneus]MBZ6474702.1 S41 family peptidase [Streptomyces griseocarneus]GHG66780.1 peptidase [Streptomyces griseocarneus]